MAATNSATIAVLLGTVAFALVFTVLGKAVPKVAHMRRGRLGSILSLLLVCACIDVLPHRWSTAVALLLSLVMTLDRIEVRHVIEEAFVGSRDGGGEDEDEDEDEGEDEEDDGNDGIEDSSRFAVPLTRNGGRLSFANSSSLETFDSVNALDDAKNKIASRQEQFQQQMSRLNSEIDQMEEFYNNLRKDA